MKRHRVIGQLCCSDNGDSLRSAAELVSWDTAAKSEWVIFCIVALLVQLILFIICGLNAVKAAAESAAVAKAAVLMSGLALDAMDLDLDVT